MFCQFSLAHEPFDALVTGEGCNSAMFEPMLFPFPLECKGFTTGATDMQFIFTVHIHVPFKSARGVACFSTDVAITFSVVGFVMFICFPATV